MKVEHNPHHAGLCSMLDYQVARWYAKPKNYSFLLNTSVPNAQYLLLEDYLLHSRKLPVFWHVPSSRHKERLLLIVLTLVRIDDNFR